MDLDRYCVRCDSDQGHSDVKPGWCAICWDWRQKPGAKIVAEIRFAWERGYSAGIGDAYGEGETG